MIPGKGDFGILPDHDFLHTNFDIVKTSDVYVHGKSDNLKTSDIYAHGKSDNLMNSDIDCSNSPACSSFDLTANRITLPFSTYPDDKQVEEDLSHGKPDYLINCEWP